MSTEEESRKPESEMGLDLDLHFLPAWAQKAPSVNQYEKFTGGEGADRERRGGRRDFGGGGGPRGPRRDGPRPQGRGPGGPGGGPGGQRPDFRREGGGGRGPGGDRRGPGGPRRGPGGPPQDRPQIKLPELEVTFFPEEKGVESLARQIKLSGRAYPLFEIGYLVLKKPERYHVQLISKKKEDGTPVQPIYVCALDDTIWLDENEAMHHVLDKHFGTFYSSEKIPTDPPKGVYTFVAQCGISGTILGPPNYHDYQVKLNKLHQERFSRMPFDMFKSRIRIVKDEAVVKKWLEEQSFRTEFTCLNIPETIKLNTRDEVERHFRETHLPNVVKPVDTYTLPGTTAVNLQNRALQSLLRKNYDDQMRFPIKVVNILSGQFARQGLQFFKVNKSVTHVAVARPHYLDMEATPVSEGIRKIVEFIDSHPRTTRKKLLEALAPGAKTAPAQPAPAPAEAPAAAPEGQPAEAAAPAEQAAPGTPPEAAAVVSDLHWLVHQGHVIEFANGILETAKKPAPRPPRPEKKKEGAPAAEQGEAEVSTVAGVAAGQGTEAEAQGETAEGSADRAAVQDESGASAGADVPSGQELPLPDAAPEQNKTEPQ
ncbi:MAG: hypothetical protein ACXW3Z_10410 [Limisphaerales bacterium]